jgi:hypothetical protein
VRTTEFITLIAAIALIGWGFNTDATWASTLLFVAGGLGLGHIYNLAYERGKIDILKKQVIAMEHVGLKDEWVSLMREFHQRSTKVN